MSRRLNLITLGLLVISLAACGSATTSPPPASVQPTPAADGPAGGYPAPGSAALGSYPAPGDGIPTVALGIPALPEAAPAPGPGRASVAGVLFSHRENRAVVHTGFYFTPATGPNGDEPPPVVGDPDPARGDYAGQTDAAGRFALADLAPGRYYVFVWAPYDWRVVENGPEDRTPRLVELRADEGSMLGVLYVDWP